eukprot:99778_1
MCVVNCADINEVIDKIEEQKYKEVIFAYEAMSNNDMENSIQQQTMSLTGTGFAPSTKYNSIITVGDEVELKTGGSVGVVRFIGEIAHQQGIFYGVELKGEDGENDGSFNNTSYFNCNDKRGMFVQQNEIIAVNTSNHQDLPRVTIGDKIECIKEKCTGTVRYIGKPSSFQGVGPFYGVELDKPNGTNDGTVRGKYYFTCKYKHGIFLQASEFCVLSTQSSKCFGNKEVNIRNCDHIVRLLECMMYYMSLNINVVECKEEFTSFCVNNYRELLNDWIHLISNHANQIEDISHQLITKYNFT